MMRRLLTAVLAAVLLGSVLASSAGAFRGFARNQQEPWFRDNAVCTDGINFNLLVSDSSQLPSPGDAPTGTLTERLQITTNQLAQNPATIDVVDPSAVLADSFTLSPIANDDARFDGATFTLNFSSQPREQVSTDFLWWGTDQQLEWSSALAPGTSLYVYLANSFDDDPSAVEMITVTDCTLFDDPPPPPPSGNPCDHPDAIHGTDGNDKIRGTNGDDIICAGDGNDRIFSYGGNDIIYAGDGNDKVHAGSGDDIVFGEGGNDNILGQWGNDTLDGGAGNDKLHGSSGDDVLIGGPGNDRLLGGKGHDTLTQ